VWCFFGSEGGLTSLCTSSMNSLCEFKLLKVGTSAVAKAMADIAFTYQTIEKNVRTVFQYTKDYVRIPNLIQD